MCTYVNILHYELFKACAKYKAKYVQDCEKHSAFKFKLALLAAKCCSTLVFPLPGVVTVCCM